MSVKRKGKHRGNYRDDDPENDALPTQTRRCRAHVTRFALPWLDIEPVKCKGDAANGQQGKNRLVGFQRTQRSDPCATQTDANQQ